MNKEDENKIIDIVEDCKLYRNAFILKRELIKKLEDAFPDVKKKSVDPSNKGGHYL